MDGWMDLPVAVTSHRRGSVLNWVSGPPTHRLGLERGQNDRSSAWLLVCAIHATQTGKDLAEDIHRTDALIRQISHIPTIASVWQYTAFIYTQIYRKHWTHLAGRNSGRNCTLSGDLSRRPTAPWRPPAAPVRPWHERSPFCTTPANIARTLHTHHLHAVHTFHTSLQPVIQTTVFTGR